MKIFRYARSAVRILKKLFALLSFQQKVYLIILFGLTLFLSLIETVGISIIMPFISVASNPDLVEDGIYKKVYDFFSFPTKLNFVLWFGIVVVVFYIFRAIYFLVYTYLQIRFALGMSRLFANKIFQRILKMPYKSYVQKNISEYSAPIGESTGASNLLLNILQICTESVMIIMLYSLIIALNWVMTLILTAILIVVMLGILRILSVSKIESNKRYEASIMQARIINDSYLNMKFVKLSCSEEKMMENFGIYSNKVARSNVRSTTIGNSPRSILESVGFSVLIAAILFILWKYNKPSIIIPTISMYALALYRILPSIHRMLGYVNTIFSLHRSLNVVSEAINIKIEEEGEEPLEFNSKIELKDACFSYLTGGEVLHNISLQINKGDSIAITGSSGGGKSTIADILIGIHKPNSGMLYVDGVPITDKNIRSWRKKIGYIPQDIYLFDGTIAENVAFYMKIDEEKLIRALKTAHLWDFLCTKEGINTRVGGMGGIMLSGGQKQRVGIARALYNDPQLLVLDEATSALDNETEGKIMDEIYEISRDKTLVIIAHRLTTVERCKKRIYLEQGRIKV